MWVFPWTAAAAAAVAVTVVALGQCPVVVFQRTGWALRRVLWKEDMEIGG